MDGHYYSFRAKPDAIPKGAVLITENDAIVLQRKFLDGWKNRFDVFPLIYSPLFTSGLAAVSSIMISNHFRRFLRLRNFGRLAIQLPTVFMPSALAAYLHRCWVTDRILLQTDCDVCIQVRSICTQVAFAVMVPSILSPLACFAYAERYQTYPLPPVLRKNWKALWEVYYNIAKKSAGKTGYLALGNFLLGLSLCFWQQHNFFEIHRTVSEEYKGMEEALEKFVGKTKPLSIISKWTT